MKRLYLHSTVLIYALDGYRSLRQHTLSQLERYSASDWVISDLVRMECLVGPIQTADQVRLLAYRSFFADCTVVPLVPEVMEQAAELQAHHHLDPTDAIHLAAAVHWGCDALLTNDQGFALSYPPLEVLRVVEPGAEQPAA